METNQMTPAPPADNPEKDQEVMAQIRDYLANSGYAYWVRVFDRVVGGQKPSPTPAETITPTELWEAIDGNPGISPTKAEALESAKACAEACDEDLAKVESAGFYPGRRHLTMGCLPEFPVRDAKGRIVCRAHTKEEAAFIAEAMNAHRAFLAGRKGA